MSKQRLPFRVYRPFAISRGIMAQPGAMVECTKLEAMMVNTMQPMTLREVTDDTRQTTASDNDENIRA